LCFQSGLLLTNTCSTDEWQRPNKDEVGLVIDNNKKILFAVGDLKHHPSSKPEPEEDEDLVSQELAGHDDVYIQPPSVERTFRGYRIIGHDERPRGGKELYAVEGDQDLPEIQGLDFGVVNECFERHAAYDEDFEVKVPAVERTFVRRTRHVSPELDFYRPQPKQPALRRLDQVRGNAPKVRSAVTAGGPAGYQIASRGVTPASRMIQQPSGSRQLQVVSSLRDEEMARPVVKWREYRSQDGPMAGPSNEIFFAANDVAAEEARRQGARQREEERLEEEARYQKEARPKYRLFRG